MSYNPYAPPTAVVDGPATDGASRLMFFPVSTFKLVVMSLCTLGMYEAYWFYMNWRFVKRRDRSNIWPLLRAIFGVFFCFSMFDTIRRDGAARSLGNAPAMAPLAALWIVATLCWKLPDPYSLVSFIAVAALVPVQGYVNRINAKIAPDHDANRRFSALNWLGIVAGGLVLSLSIIQALASNASISGAPLH